MTQDDENAYVAFRLPLLQHELPTRETVVKGIENKIEELEKEMLQLPTLWEKLTRKNRRALGQLLTQKRVLTGRLQQERIRYENLKSSVKDHALRERFRAMNDVPRVRSATLVADAVGTKLVILTEPLFGRSGEAKTWHRVGSFRITTRIGPGADLDHIVFENLDGPLDIGQKFGSGSYLMHGPTGIGEDGQVGCYGNARQVIGAAFKEADDLGLVEILVRYPECAGANDYIKFWPEVVAADVPAWYLQHE